jgi:hypothetical protein
LFSPPLEPALTESSNSTRTNRRDIILPNYAVSGFWAFARQHYKADFVVADAKNYVSAIGKNEIIHVANYLSPQGAGLLGLIITRKGVDSAGSWTLREQWLMHSKMIVVLVDEDVTQMLSMRDVGEDPSTIVRQRIEDFRLQI